MPPERRSVAVTGAGGFIGANLVVRLRELGFDLRALNRGTSQAAAEAMLREADAMFHLAGAVRPLDPSEFDRTRDYAAWAARTIGEGGRRPLVVCASSVSAGDDTPYGRSKRGVEQALLRLAALGQATTVIYRLPNVFGKWARPNYNSCVATFCHNLACGLPIRIDNPDAPLALLYVDDLIEQWARLLVEPSPASGFREPDHIHRTTVGEVAAMVRGFADGRVAGRVANVGAGLGRALYATFVSALPPEAFSYPLVEHTDTRGGFTEMLKTPTSGQVSFFTAHPGVTRGGHYHHTKVEKFLVVQGEALFRFRHILSGEAHEVRTCGERPVVVETAPGWTHDVTNVGDGPMISVIWASEVFDRERPDTVAMAV